MKYLHVALGAAALGLVSTSALALTVTQNDNADTLANSVTGSGITIESASLTGAANASGTFSDGVSSGIGIEDGIILSSGNVSDAPGPNTTDSQTTIFNTIGFDDLDALIPGFSTNDGVRLDVEFTTDTGDVFFDYVFASEEYNEFVFSSFNDVFGLFLNGENIAIVPGTTDPVSIDTVNNGVNFSGTNAENPDLYNNNDPSDGGPFFDLEYDGFTDVFTAEFLGLDTSLTHTLSFAIADAGDFALDSAIFIAGGSLSSVDPVDPPVDPVDPIDVVPVPASLPLLLAGLGGIAFLRRNKRKS